MNRRRSGSANPVVPFAVVLIIAIVAVAGYSCFRIGQLLTTSQTEKSEALTRTLAAALADPFSMGEYDHMQHILEALQKSDPNVAYAIVVTTDGKAIATTDAALKDVDLTRNDFEKEALKATDFAVRTEPSKHCLESMMPITTAMGNCGVLRIGTLNTKSNNAVTEVSIMATIVAVCAVIISIVVSMVVGPKPPSPTT